MIYSPAFRALPAEVRQAIYTRMREVLSGGDPNPRYARMVETDRHDVIEILRETVADLPAAWQNVSRP